MSRRVDSEIGKGVADEQVFPVGVVAFSVNAVADRREKIPVVAGVADGRGRDLFETGLTAGVLCPRARLVQRRQQQTGQNRDDRYYIDLKKLIS